MSDELAELFNLEVDEFNKKPKSEEEIQKMCTKDDLSELQRASFLLRKGYEIQKLAVINNLHRYSKECGANEDLLSLIIISLEDWDNKMQIECAQAFIQPLKDNLLSKDNRQRLLQACMDIVTNENNENETLKETWILVFDHVVGQVEFAYVQLVALKPIQELTDRKSSFQKRKLGNRLLTSLVKQCGEAAIDADRLVLRLIMQICGDTNYKIRMDGAVFFKEYLAKNHETLIGTTRLEKTYIPEILELCNDEETYIRIEAVDCVQYILETLTVELVEDQVIPSVLKMLQSDHDEIVLRVSQFIGQLAHKLSQVGNLHLKYKEDILEFYKALCVHKIDECRQNAAYCLPCMNSLYKRQLTSQTFTNKKSVQRTVTGITTASSTYDDEESKDGDAFQEGAMTPFEFSQVYFQFSQDADERIRVITASCIHEGFLAAQDDEDTSLLRDTLHELMQDDSKEVMTALCQNLEVIIAKYANTHSIVTHQNDGSQPLSMQQNLLPPLLNLKNQADGSNNKMSNTTTNRLGKSKRSRQFPEYEEPKLTYIYLPEYTSEQVYSQLLTNLIILKHNLGQKIAMWREWVLFQDKLSSQVQKFHIPELQDRLVSLLFDDIKRGNTQVRQMTCRCLVKILAHQHDCKRRTQLTHRILTQFGESSSFQMRKIFIQFCKETVGNISRQQFEDNFFATWFNLSTDKVSGVRQDFAKSVFELKPFLDSKPALHTQLHDCISRLKTDSNSGVAESMDVSDFDLLKQRKKATQQLQEKEDKNLQRQKKLDQREALEIEEKKKRMDEDEENRYEQYIGAGANSSNAYGQSNRVGVKVGKRILKASALPAGAKQQTVTISAATVKRTPVGLCNSDTKVVTMTKRKIITSNSKRNSSALPELNQNSALTQSDQNKVRKKSILLPTGSSSIFDKQNQTIPGLKKGDHHMNTDNYSRKYTQINQPVVAQTQQPAPANAYKRSNSLLTQPPSESKSKLVKKKREETAAAAYYQKPPSKSSMLMQSDSSSSLSDDDRQVYKPVQQPQHKPSIGGKSTAPFTYNRQNTFQPHSRS